MQRRSFLIFAGLALLAACGGQSPEPVRPVATTPSAAAPAWSVRFRGAAVDQDGLRIPASSLALVDAKGQQRQEPLRWSQPPTVAAVINGRETPLGSFEFG